MLACTGIFVTEAGFRWPGYLSKSLDLKFEDVPGGALDSYAAVPALGWLQIVAFIIILELGYGATPPGNAPGDVGGPTWIRYDDPEVGRCRAPRGARPPMARSSDDFPAPDGPMTQPTSPAGAHPSARFTTSAAPHARPTPRHARSRPSSSLESSSSSSSSAAAKSSAISPSILIPSRRSGLVRKARRLSPSTSARAAARSANWCACSVSTGRRTSKVHAETAGCGLWTWSTTGMSGAAVALS